jgi:hypothetical protein
MLRSPTYNILTLVYFMRILLVEDDEVLADSLIRAMA